jgi:hypothetical protein
MPLEAQSVNVKCLFVIKISNLSAAQCQLALYTALSHLLIFVRIYLRSGIIYRVVRCASLI